MKCAHIEEKTNKVLGWYDKDIHKNIPMPNVEVSNKIWQEAIDNNANEYDKDTKTFVVKDFRTADEIEKDAEYESKVKKESELNLLQVSINNVSYDAHMEAMGNMGIVIAVASFEMWKAWASLSAENLAVYNAVFKQTVVWKGATNERHVVQIESVAETAKKAMEAKAEILFKY